MKPTPKPAAPSKPAPVASTADKTNAGPTGPNYVHENIIRAANIKKENHFLTRNRSENFQLNPYTFYPHYEKPTKVNPWNLKQKQEELKRQIQTGVIPPKEDTYLECYTEDPVLESVSTSNISKTLKSTALVPRQKSARPQTANQEIGWFCQPYNVYPQRENFKVTSDPITKWNGSYCVDHKINPFKVKNRFTLGSGANTGSAAGIGHSGTANATVTKTVSAKALPSNSKAPASTKK